MPARRSLGTVRKAAVAKLATAPRVSGAGKRLLTTGRYHWIFDATNVPKQVTLDPALLEKTLRDLARLCEMKIVGGPLAVEGIPSNPGYTAVCIVDFSHIAIHTFSNPREVCVDIFSCKPFQPKKVHEYLLKTFKASKEQSMFYDARAPHEYGKVLPFQDCVSVPRALA